MRDVETYEESRKRREPPKWWTPRIDRNVLKDLMQRSNMPDIFYGAVRALIVLGYVSARLYKCRECMVILAFFVYGTISA